MAHYTKDPSAVLDYEFDWTDWLDSAGSETISTHTVSANQGVVVDSTTVADGIITAWVSGGTAGRISKVVCEIVTSAGRTDQRTLPLTIKDR